MANLISLSKSEFTIEFGKAERFDNGKGLLLPAMAESQEFEKLRKRILVGLIDKPRKQKPHITLMHPVNSTCTDMIFEKILKFTLAIKLSFSKISLIEQTHLEKWKVLTEYNLKTKN